MNRRTRRTSNENQKITLTLGQLKRLVRESRSDYVGVQKFTYAELEDAWNKLKSNVENEPDYEGYIYDIRGFYETDSMYKSCWLMDFSLEDIIKKLESIPETIIIGYLDVYWNDEEEADEDNHGIIIKDGKIVKIN